MKDRRAHIPTKKELEKVLKDHKYKTKPTAKALGVKPQTLRDWAALRDVDFEAGKAEVGGYNLFRIEEPPFGKKVKMWGADGGVKSGMNGLHATHYSKWFFAYWKEI